MFHAGWECVCTHIDFRVREGVLLCSLLTPISFLFSLAEISCKSETSSPAWVKIRFCRKSLDFYCPSCLFSFGPVKHKLNMWLCSCLWLSNSVSLTLVLSVAGTASPKKIKGLFHFSNFNKPTGWRQHASSLFTAVCLCMLHPERSSFTLNTQHAHVSDTQCTQAVIVHVHLRSKEWLFFLLLLRDEQFQPFTSWMNGFFIRITLSFLHFTFTFCGLILSFMSLSTDSLHTMPCITSVLCLCAIP